MLTDCSKSLTLNLFPLVYFISDMSECLLQSLLSALLIILRTPITLYILLTVSATGKIDQGLIAAKMLHLCCIFPSIITSFQYYVTRIAHSPLAKSCSMTFLRLYSMPLLMKASMYPFYIPTHAI